MEKLREFHMSDCATHNEPGQRNGPCNCGAEQNRAINKLGEGMKVILGAMLMDTIDIKTLEKLTNILNN